MLRTLLLLLAITAAAQAEDAPGLAAVARLEAEAAGPSADLERIRAGLLALRVAYPGPVAARAALALTHLPSPLDRLDPSAIPPMERFEGQPKELVAVVGDHRGRHGGGVAAVAYSADGKRLVSAGAAAVRVWDAATMRLVGAGRTGVALTSVCWSKDGTRVACGGSGGGVLVYTVGPDGAMTLAHSLRVATTTVAAVAFHPDGKQLAAAAGDGPIRVYDVSGKKAEDLAQATGHPSAVHTLAFSPDGKLLASGGADQTVRLWSPGRPEYREVSHIANNPAAVTAVTFSPTGKTLASGLADGSVRLWSVPASARPKLPRAAFAPGKSPIRGLSYSPTGLTLAVANGEPGVRLWSVSGFPKFRSKIDGHSGPARAVAYSPDGKVLASGGDDWMVRSFDVSKPRPLERFVSPGHLGYVYSTAFTPDGKGLATGGIDRLVRLWDVSGTGPKAGKVLKGEDVPVHCVAYSPDGRFLAATGQTTRVRQWETTSLKVRTSLVRHVANVSQVAYSPDGKLLMTRSAKEVLLCDPVTGGIEHALAGHEAGIHHAAFSPDGRRVATVSGEYERDDRGRYVLKGGEYVPRDCAVRVFDVEKGAEQQKWSKFTRIPVSAAWLIGRHEILTVQQPPQVLPIEVTTTGLKPGTPWEGAGAWPVPTPDGQSVYTQSGATVMRWEPKGGKPLAAWTVPEVVTGVSVASDGRHLAVGLETGVVYILRTGPPRKLPAKGGRRAAP